MKVLVKNNTSAAVGCGIRRTLGTVLRPRRKATLVLRLEYRI